MRTTNITDIKKALASKVISFSYTKKDGTVRTANGTTNHSIITSLPTFSGFKGGENKVAKVGYTSYFDTDKNEWRCFAESKLISAEI